MQQLSGVDTSFLMMETPTTYGHICSVTFLEPTDRDTPALPALHEALAQRLPRFRQFRRRLVEVPFGLDRPYWVEDPHFDIDFHLRQLALPPPGDEQAFSEQVARIVARPLDRTRPLWELYLIDGLANGHVAMMVKIHHAAIDGEGGRELMLTLLDDAPGADQLPAGDPAKPERVPEEPEMLLRGLVGLATQPWKVLRWQQRLAQSLPDPLQLSRAWRSLAESVERFVEPTINGEGGLLPGPKVVAPRTPFNRTIGAHRRWAYGSVPLDDAKAIKNAFGTTLNDVVMAVCATVLRRWLLTHDALPDRPLLVAVPISVRAKGGEAMDADGNQVSAMLALLPTHLEDPVERLRASSEAMNAAKEQHKAVPAAALTDATQFLMPALSTAAARLAARTGMADMVRPPYNVLISNVPGPRTQLHLAGTTMRHFYPVSAIVDGQGLNITVQSYTDSLDFGLTADRELVPDLWDMMGFVPEAFDELRARIT